MLQLNMVHNLDFFVAYDNEIIPKGTSVIITDPPYGIEGKYGRDNKTIKSDNLNTYYQFIECANDLLRKNGTLITFCSEKVLDKIILYFATNTDFIYRHCCVYKTNIGLGGKIRNEYDFILIYTKQNDLNVSEDFRLFQQEFVHNTKGKTHPHQKDYNVIRNLIKTFALKTDIILDCFSGSGAVSKVCAVDGYNFIAFEIDSEYCKDSNETIKNIFNQNKLF